jgi:hypothetical protein
LPPAAPGTAVVPLVGTPASARLPRRAIGPQRSALGAAAAVPLNDTAGVHGNPAWDEGTAWSGPAAWGLLPATAAMPVATLDALLRSAARRLAGRRFTVPGTELRLRVDALEVRPDPVGLALGQFDDVRLVAGDLEWRGLACERLVVVCRNVHVRPLPAPTVVSAPVEVELTLLPPVVRERVAAVRPCLRLEVGTDGEPRLHWARRPHWAALVVAAEVADSALHLRPVAVRRGPRRLPLPRWLPPVRIRVPALPRALRLHRVDVGPEVIVLHLRADQWRDAVLADRLAGLAWWLERLGGPPP